MSSRKRKNSFGSDKGTKASKVKEEQQEQIPTSVQDEFRCVKMFTDLLSLTQSVSVSVETINSIFPLIFIAARFEPKLFLISAVFQ